MKQEQPDPIQCPECKTVYVFEQDKDGDWWLGYAQWWFHRELGIDFLCSRPCWLKANARYVPRETSETS